MGLEKRVNFDHSLETVFEAAGYSEQIVKQELEPRAGLLANQIVSLAGVCPTMAIEILMDSPILRDTALDSRDRAMIILLAGPVIASALAEQAMDDPAKLQKVCDSNHGFDHNSGAAQYQVLRISKTEWDSLMQYARNTVMEMPRPKQISRLVENVEKFLDNKEFNSLQKAVVEAAVVKNSAVEAARKMTPLSAVIGALADVEREGAG
ncbi:MAG: hypothetical protein A4E57_03471 [Syntrophorhabdaceae bacterium PtaU1.Bin034]|jgi:hypothetical protein|nr:MAG: hypothetical protein A4E57_03471 [Syntrophorhabdaceae bacterium PtaU1.Bin034]